MNDRALSVLRYVIVPIIVAAISGYFVKQTAREQTKASYEALAPVVSGLQDEVARLEGRVEELSKTTRVIVLRSDTPKPPWTLGEQPKPSAGALGSGKVEVQVETESGRQAVRKPAAKFDDMLKGL